MPGALKVRVTPTTWAVIGGQGTAGDPGPQVYVGTEPPTDPDLDLWWDTDAVSGIDLVPPWIPLPLATGWVHYNAPTYSISGYRKIGDTVYLRGLISKSATPLSTICTLPVGYRPPAYILLNSMIAGNGAVIRAPVRLDLATTGVLTFGSAALPTHTTMPALTSIDHLTLDGLNFSTSP